MPPEHLGFLQAYQKAFNDHPRISSLVGYTTMKALAAGIARAGSTNSEALSKAFEGLEFMSPSGKVTFRAVDHHSTLRLSAANTAPTTHTVTITPACHIPRANF